MKLLWLCNMVPGVVKKAITGKEGNGLWVDHVLQDLRRQENLQIHILCPYNSVKEGRLDDRCSYRTFRTRLPYEYLPELESRFLEELKAFQPDVIHSWGVEYAHTLAMVNAAEQAGLMDHMAISIQGLCAFIERHYAEGVPHRVQQGFTFRDLLRRDNIAMQRKKFYLRGQLEKQALGKIRHVIGRTHWDRACTEMVAPQAKYHVCNETLRPVFYEDGWEYTRCSRHRIFASSCSYPVKGFHYLLEAMAEVKKTYPDVTLTVPGSGYLGVSRLRRNRYQKYLEQLTKQYGLEDKIEFLGSLDGEGMKKAYLDANVFVQPSTIENSPNSLGEAMILGVPCVAADVGGVTTMMAHEKEGFVYQSTAPYLLADYIKTVFAMEEAAGKMGEAAHIHARRTHDPEKNLQDLLNIYHRIQK